LVLNWVQGGHQLTREELELATAYLRASR